MAGITKTKKDKKVDHVIHDASEELEALRRELDKYRVIFDSARLIVGHEFIKPLTSIRGYFELLENDLEQQITEKERRYFSKVKEAICRMEDLIDSFIQALRFDSRAESVHELEKVDLYLLVEKVKERLGKDAGRLENEVDADLPALFLKRRSLEIVLENLISNAVMHGGGSAPVKVTASLQRERRGAAKEQLLMVSVADHGPGIPADNVKDIFTPFCRVGGDEKVPGLGLGLALVKSIITIMSGEIHINSKQGEGTTVTFTIPVTDRIQGEPGKVG